MSEIFGCPMANCDCSYNNVRAVKRHFKNKHKRSNINEYPFISADMINKINDKNLTKISERKGQIKDFKDQIKNLEGRNEKLKIKFNKAKFELDDARQEIIKLRKENIRLSDLISVKKKYVKYKIHNAKPFDENLLSYKNLSPAIIFNDDSILIQEIMNLLTINKAKEIYCYYVTDLNRKIGCYLTKEGTWEKDKNYYYLTKNISDVIKNMVAYVYKNLLTINDRKTDGRKILKLFLQREKYEHQQAYEFLCGFLTLKDLKYKNDSQIGKWVQEIALQCKNYEGIDIMKQVQVTIDANNEVLYDKDEFPSERTETDSNGNKVSVLESEQTLNHRKILEENYGVLKEYTDEEYERNHIVHKYMPRNKENEVHPGNEEVVIRDDEEFVIRDGFMAGVNMMEQTLNKYKNYETSEYEPEKLSMEEIKKKSMKGKLEEFDHKEYRRLCRMADPDYDPEFDYSGNESDEDSDENENDNVIVVNDPKSDAEEDNNNNDAEDSDLDFIEDPNQTYENFTDEETKNADEDSDSDFMTDPDQPYGNFTDEE